MKPTKQKGAFSRRAILKGSVAVLTMPAIAGRAYSAETLIVRDTGGLFQTAVNEAFYKPFTKETGIEIVGASAAPDPAAAVKAMVETKSYTWDVIQARSALTEQLGAAGLLEEIDWSGPDMQDLIPKAKWKYCMGLEVFSTVMGYREDQVKAAPRTWADFWNVEKFPGRRAIQKYPTDVLEFALMADGVAPDKLYPLDLTRAFKSLDKIRKHVNVWYTNAAQATQLLQSGEVDMISTWNARVQAAIDDGKPVKIEWNQGIYAVEGWGIPKGNPKKASAQKFVQYCANPKHQAEFAKIIAYGPTNPKAFEFISDERAKMLPTYPENLAKMIYPDDAYWIANQAKIREQFNAWLLG